MASASVPITEPTSPYSMNWIVNKKADLLLFIGGALTGYLMFFLHAGLHLNMLMVWFIWVVLIDTPHFYSTYLRTYFDKEEYQARKKLSISLSVIPIDFRISRLSRPAVAGGSFRFPKS